MTGERRHQIDSLYRAAANLNSRQRAAFLAEACRDEPELLREVETLLADKSAAQPDGILVGLSTQTQAAPGAKLGPYQLEVLLGEGGMGQVFRARDTRLGRLVAIKVIREERAKEGDFRQRFQREARATAALNHPHICTLYDVG